MTDLHVELTHILKQHLLFPVFQPSVSTQQEKISDYEAFIRDPQNSVLHHPYFTAYANKQLSRTLR